MIEIEDFGDHFILPGIIDMNSNFHHGATE